MSAGAAEAYARLMAPHIDEARAAGATSLSNMADYLNKKGLFTRWGHAWSKNSLYPFLKRLEEMKKRDDEI
jgi:hypothetical protein